MSSKFGALSKLNASRPAPSEPSNPETEAARNQGVKDPRNLENEETRNIETKVVEQSGAQKARTLVSEESRNQEISKPSLSESEEPWIALGTEVRRATKRRLKAYAGANGGKLKELVDLAITNYLDSLEK